MKMYKVLKVVYGGVYSPFQNFYYGELDEIVGKEFMCENFDESDDECSNGFYATEIDGLIYCLNNNKNNRVFEEDH